MQNYGIKNWWTKSKNLGVKKLKFRCKYYQCLYCFCQIFSQKNDFCQNLYSARILNWAWIVSSHSRSNWSTRHVVFAIYIVTKLNSSSSWSSWTATQWEIGRIIIGSRRCRPVLEIRFLSVNFNSHAVLASRLYIPGLSFGI